MKRLLFLFTVVFATGILRAQTNDLVIADFEGETFGNWTSQGEAFGSGPTAGAVPGQKAVKGFAGKRLANSAAGGLTATGQLTSPDFQIARNYIRFLIGGAEMPGKTGINLVVDGKTVRTATGLKRKGGRAQTMRDEDWDVSEFKGKTARIEIIDTSALPTGQILVADIRQTDEALQQPAFDLVVTRHYLLLPVRNKANMIPLQVVADGKVVREFEIELAIGVKPDWKAACDLSAFAGKTVTIRSMDKLPPAVAGPIPRLLEQSDEPVTARNLYQEAFRPQFHYTVRRGYNNDPNGLVFYNGKYHMFYQNNPYGTDWGNMHWGHAVSTDLLHWTEMSPAIYPRNITDGAFSGGAMVDHGNRLGFGQGHEDVLVASYAGIGRGECIAQGTGDVQSLTDIPEDPVLQHSGWDPNIMPYEAGNKWLMVVFEKQPPKYGYAFYDSTNLINWHELQLVEGFQDCPDFFQLPVAGETTRKWVLYGSKKEPNLRYASRSSYMIGSFDGQKFTPETDIIEGHAGPQFYAGQTFKNVADGRRIMIGWLSGAAYPGMPFSQGMTVPLELTLHRTGDGVRLAFYPIKEIAQLHGRHYPGGQNLSIADANTALGDITGELLDGDLAIVTGTSGRFTLSVHGLDISYDATTKQLTGNGTSTTVAPEAGEIHLRMLVDRGVLEVFANEGLGALAFGGNIFSDNSLKLAGSPHVTVKSLDVFDMNSIWNK
jgi:fructan beta-fructosidase